jgi:hypothetical protein
VGQGKGQGQEQILEKSKDRHWFDKPLLFVHFAEEVWILLTLARRSVPVLGLMHE